LKQRLVQTNGKAGGKSEFSRMASAISKDINGTTVKLGKLAQRESSLVRKHRIFHGSSVAKRKTLFDDRPVEISVRLTAL
jgi:syntaxin 5